MGKTGLLGKTVLVLCYSVCKKVINIPIAIISNSPANIYPNISISSSTQSIYFQIPII